VYPIRQIVGLSLAAWLALAVAAYGQRPPIHYSHSANLPPGTVGAGQLQRFAALRCYSQPVEIRVPKGARVALQADGHFDEASEASVVVGMQVGSVYQIKITEIPFHLGHEVFPTIEIVNRIYPPPGQELRFPVPVQFTQEELELAMSGKYVTRVIYLEDPETALGYADDRDEQRYFEVGPSRDPLRVADQLGRPVAIMRMGSRVPDWENGQVGLGYGHAPLIRYSRAEVESAGTDTQAAIERQGYNIPRISISGEPRARATLPAGLTVP
jgi:hypothetical protein